MPWSTIATAGSTRTIETSFNNETIGADEWLYYAASAVASTPTKIWIGIEYTED